MERKSENEMLTTIKTNFTARLYEWLKIDFSNTCIHEATYNDVDTYINELLDELHSVYVLKTKTEMAPTVETKYIIHIYNRYIYCYLEGLAPQPLWDLLNK